MIPITTKSTNAQVISFVIFLFSTAMNTFLSLTFRQKIIVLLKHFDFKNMQK